MTTEAVIIDIVALTVVCIIEYIMISSSWADADAERARHAETAADRDYWRGRAQAAEQELGYRARMSDIMPAGAGKLDPWAGE